MPIEKSVLGFSNRWYPGSIESAQPLRLASGRAIRVIATPFFLGTKFEAFRERGNRDFYSSRDLEDFISVLDGRESVLEEIAATSLELRIFLAHAAQKLLSEVQFLDALPGYFLPDEISQKRMTVVMLRLKALSSA